MCTKKNLTEEEVVNSIFNNFKLSSLDVIYVYEEFLKAVSGKDTSSYTIDSSIFRVFLGKIVDKNEYKESHITFFENLLPNNKEKPVSSIRRIGSILIFLSKGSLTDKLNALENHLNTFYGNKDRNVKDFLSDMIEINTELCMLSFKSNLDAETQKSLGLIWKKHRKQKYLLKLYVLYEESKQLSLKRDLGLTAIKHFLTNNMNMLYGENIRNFLYEEYLEENNPFYNK